MTFISELSVYYLTFLVNGDKLELTQKLLL